MGIIFLNQKNIKIENKSIIIYPGSFSPFHIQHLNNTIDVYNKFKTSDNDIKIIILPASDSYNKKYLMKNSRYELIKQVLQNYENLPSNIIASDIEYKQDRQPNTYYTMLEFQEIYPDYHIYMLCGLDVYNTLVEPNLWDPEQVEMLLSDKYGVIVIPRNMESKTNISSSEIRRRFINNESYDDLTYEPIVEYLVKNRDYYIKYWAQKIEK